MKVKRKQIPASDVNFSACGPVCPSRVEMLGKSYTNTWTDEDKQEIEKSLVDFKGLPVAKDYFKNRNMRKFTCCICGCDFYDWTGCNPYPIMDGEKYTCCHDCNDRFVMPTRILNINMRAAQ